MKNCEVAVHPICRLADGSAEIREVGKEGKNKSHPTEHP
jgi:hypothetical protein